MSFEKNAKDFFKKLGVKASELEAENADISALVERVETGIIDNNRDDIEANAKTTAATAAYNKVAKQLAAKFGLDYTKYESLQKGQFDAVLKDAAEAYEGKGGETSNPTANPKDAADVAALKARLADVEAMHKAALDENKKYKDQLEGLPAQIEAAKESVILDYESTAQIKSAMSKLRQDGLNPLFEDDMIIAQFQKAARVKPVKTNDGYAYQITDPDGRPIKKSATEAYSDVYSFMRDKVVKENWIVKNADPNTGAGNFTPQNTGANSGAGKGGKNIDIASVLPPGAY